MKKLVQKLSLVMLMLPASYASAFDHCGCESCECTECECEENGGCSHCDD